MRIIVGISGASGVVLGYELLRALKTMDGCEVHLVMTKAAVRTIEIETDLRIEDISALADFVHQEDNMAASISSGSFVTDGMIVAPCSMKSLAHIAHGLADNLLVRAADVCLKEGRRVVLVPREMPLGVVHLRNMLLAAENGCRIVAPMLTFYNQPDSLSSQINHVVGKVLMQFGFVPKDFIAWKGL